MAKQNRKSQSTKSTTKEVSVKKTAKPLSKDAQLVKATDFRSEAAQVVKHAKSRAQLMVQLAKVAAVTFQRCTKLARGNAKLFKSLWGKFTKTVVATASVLSPDTAGNLSSQLSQLKRLMEHKQVFATRFAAGKYDQAFTYKVNKKSVMAFGTLTDVKALSKTRYTFDESRIAKMVFGMCRSNKARVRLVVGQLNTMLRAR